MVFNNIGFPTKGGRAIYWPKYKEKETNSFANLLTNIETIDNGNLKFHNGFLIINLLSVIQWANTAQRCFLTGKQPYTRFFFITMAFRSVGDTKSDFSLTEG